MTLVNTARPFGEFAVKPLVDGVLWIEHSDPGTVRAGMSTNGYAVLGDGEALVLDAPFGFLMAALERIDRDGHRPVGLVLSHNHLVGHHDIGPAFRRTWDAPVMLHPVDAADLEASDDGFRFEDPMGSPLVARFGLEAIHFPGQTEGSIMLYRESDGLLLTGDSAMGTTVGQSERGVRHLVRPPRKTSVDDGGLRDRWNGFDRPVRHLAPLHGTPQVDRPDLGELMRDLSRAGATQDIQGSVQD